MKDSKIIQYTLRQYFMYRPIFLGLIRAKEAELFNRFLKFEPYMYNLHVLDIGCGDGFFFHILRKLGVISNRWMVVGIDVKLKHNKTTSDLGQYYNVEEYDGTKIRYPDNYFDFIISNCVLEHVKDLDMHLAEIFRILKPNRKFYVTVMSKRWEDNMFFSIFLGKLYLHWMRFIQKHFNLLTVEKWNKVFDTNGFEVLNAVGYMDKTASMLLDLMHYISLVPWLIYKIAPRMKLFPAIIEWLGFETFFGRLLEKDVNVNEASAIFYVLKKASSEI